MFVNYTKKARRVIFFARWEASQFGSPYIETEHLLLGLLREDRDTAKRVERSGTSVESIRKQIEAHTPVREKVSTAVDLPLSQPSKRTLAYAAEEAQRLSHHHIGTEHLVLGLLREETCMAAKILKQCDLRLERLRTEFRRECETPVHTGVASASSLSVISRNLVKAATENELDPLIGRQGELESIVRTLCRRTKNNPVLVGEPGVGKTAIVHGLGQRIATGNVPWHLKNRLLLALDLSPIVAVTGQGSQLEERVMTVLKELIEAADLIVFIEDLFASAGAGNPINKANLLKPLVTQGEIQCIATGTPADYRKAVEAKTWLAACFKAIEVRPAEEAEAVKILVGIKQCYERFHSVVYTDEAIHYAVYHSQRYIPGRYLPGKAIDLIDEAGAAVAVRPGALPEEVIEAQKRLKFIMQRMESAIQNHEFERARFYSEEDRKERENLLLLREKYHIDNAMNAVTVDDIENIVAQWTGVPIATIREGRSPAGPGGYGGQAS